MSAPRSKGHRLSPAGRLVLALLLNQGRATGTEMASLQRKFYPERSAAAVNKLVYSLRLYGLTQRVPGSHPQQYELTADGRTVATQGSTPPARAPKGPRPKPQAIACRQPVPLAAPATARVKWGSTWVTEEMDREREDIDRVGAMPPSTLGWAAPA